MSVLLHVFTDPIGPRPLVEDLGPAPHRPPHRLDDLGDVTLLDELLVVEHGDGVGEVAGGPGLPVPQGGGVAQGGLHPGSAAVAVEEELVSLVDKLGHETLADLRQHVIRRGLVQLGHQRPLGELLEYSQSHWQVFLDIRRVFSDLELLHLLGFFVQLEVIKDHGNEETHHDESDKEMIENEEKCHQRSYPGNREAHRLLHDLGPRLLGQDLEHRHEGVWEGGEVDVELVGLFLREVTEELHGDAGGDQQQVNGEDHEAEIANILSSN